MQLTENRRQITVGIFIFIGLIIFVVGIFTLGSQKKAFIKSFGVNVIFNDIQGLKVGDNVWFSGVKIGTIKKINFYGTSQVQVALNIEEEARKYIHKDASASISSDGLIGNKIIVISGGTLKFPFIEDGDQIRVNTALSTDEIMQTLQVNNKNLVEITSNFKTLSGNLVAGKGTVGALLSDEKMADDLKVAMMNLQRTTQTANEMVLQLNAFGKKLNTKGGLIDELLTDTAVFTKVEASVNEFQAAAKSASLLSENLNNASSKLNQNDNAAGLLLNDQQTAEQIKQIIRNLQGSSEKLDEDLKALQSNFLFRGYFKKKAKEEAAAAKENIN